MLLSTVVFAKAKLEFARFVLSTPVWTAVVSWVVIEEKSAWQEEARVSGTILMVRGRGFFTETELEFVSVTPV